MVKTDINYNAVGMESNFNDLKTETMTTEQKEKLMLADDLTAYINQKHTQEECIGFIDGYNAALAKLKLFSIPDVMPCGDCSTKTSPCRTINCQYSKVHKA